METKAPSRFRRATIWLALLATGCGHVPNPAFVARPVVSGEMATRLDSYFEAAASRGFNGAALVERNGEIVLAKGYGWSDREAGRTSLLDTVYPIGSVTKQFTGAAVLKLVSEGKISTEDRITRFFANVPADKAQITIHQLLTHTAGLPQRDGSCTVSTTRKSFVDSVLSAPLEHAPGAIYHYSNMGYNLLAAIVEQASGREFEQYVRERLWLPAGMPDTGIILPRWPRERVATGYRRGARWGTIFEKGLSEPTWPPTGNSGRLWCGRGAGIMHSTLRDLHRWHHTLLQGRILPAEQMREYFKPHVAEEPGPNPTSWYGYGWTIYYRQPGRRLVTWHNGGILDIFFSNFVRMIDDRTTYILLSNPFQEEQNAIDLSPGAQKIILSGRSAS